MRLVFAGTPAAAVPSLRMLIDSPGHEVVAVVTRPAARAGRGRREVVSPVAELAVEAGIQVLSPDRAGDPGFLGELAALEPDCCPVVAYGALLPPAALSVPRLGWVNLHFSLLPAWRGAAPVQHAILHGDEVTGASTFLIEAGLDTGPVYGVVTETIRATDTAGDLLARLADSGAGLLAATMDGLAAGALVAEPQPAEGVSIAGKITVADARIGWDGPVRPRGDNQLRPGALRATKAGVSVGTATVEVELGTVQSPGKRPMPAADWARGARIEDGEILGD